MFKSYDCAGHPLSVRVNFFLWVKNTCTTVRTFAVSESTSITCHMSSCDIYVTHDFLISMPQPHYSSFTTSALIMLRSIIGRGKRNAVDDGFDQPPLEIQRTYSNSSTSSTATSSSDPGEDPRCCRPCPLLFKCLCQLDLLLCQCPIARRWSSRLHTPALCPSEFRGISVISFTHMSSSLNLSFLPSFFQQFEQPRPVPSIFGNCDVFIAVIGVNLILSGTQQTLFPGVAICGNTRDLQNHVNIGTIIKGPFARYLKAHLLDTIRLYPASLWPAPLTP